MSHSLIFLQDVPYSTGFFVCNLCREKGSGAVFHCSACNFDLHPSCIATGVEICHFSHFWHPLYIEDTEDYKTSICDVCGDAASPNVFHCQECDFDAHPHCARAPRFVQHPFHKHILQLILKKDAYSGSCRCSICNKEATDQVYHCSFCDFAVHIFCAMLPWSPYHSKHPEHRLKLLENVDISSQNVLCEGCGKNTSAWVYGCQTCGFFLDVSCAKIPQHTVPALLDLEALSYRPPLASSNDVEITVKMMERLLVSSAEPVTAIEADAARKALKMIAQQVVIPGWVPRTGSMLIEDGDKCSCPICLEDYASELQRRVLSCRHHFHTGCILQWLDSSNCCPVCQKKVIFIDGD